MHVIIPQLLTGSEPRLYAISDRVSIWMQMRITFQVLDHHAGSIMQQTTGGSSNFRDFFGGANMAFADRVGIFNRSPGMTVGYDGVCLGLELVRVIFLLHCRWIGCSSFFDLAQRSMPGVLCLGPQDVRLDRAEAGRWQKNNRIRSEKILISFAIHSRKGKRDWCVRVCL